MAVKRQVIANFITEFTNMEGQGAGECLRWSIHTDGSSNKQASKASVVLHSPKGDKVECMVWLDFLTTNYKAKYKTLITGLDLAKATGATDVVMYCDSQAVTSQVNGDYNCKGEWMKKYLKQVKKQTSDLLAKFLQIPWEENEQADRLAKATSTEHMLIPS